MSTPVVIATWPFGRTAADVAGKLLAAGSPALDAALAGAQAVEDDPAVRSVGVGALGNSIGAVSRDACVMDGRTLDCGAVAGLENIRHAAAVAHRVMTVTPYVLLVGDGALWFALQQGFPMQSHHTPESVADWHARHPANPSNIGAMSDQPFHTAADIGIPAGIDNHDTVTVLARDGRGHLGGVCTTSGLAYKLPGRVGDSPIVGAGLYVDDEAGAAGSTGVGEEVLRISGSSYIVEQMRSGKSAQDAVELGVQRILAVAARRGRKRPGIAFIAIDRDGTLGAACTAGTAFDYAVGRGTTVELLRAKELG